MKRGLKEWRMVSEEVEQKRKTLSDRLLLTPSPESPRPLSLSTSTPSSKRYPGTEAGAAAAISFYWNNRCHYPSYGFDGVKD